MPAGELVAVAERAVRHHGPEQRLEPGLVGQRVDHAGREHDAAGPDQLVAERDDEAGAVAGATEVTASSRTVTVSYAASSLRAAARNSAGGVPSWVTTLCMCAAGSLR